MKIVHITQLHIFLNTAGRRHNYAHKHCSVLSSFISSPVTYVGRESTRDTPPLPPPPGTNVELQEICLPVWYRLWRHRPPGSRDSRGSFCCPRHSTKYGLSSSSDTENFHTGEKIGVRVNTWGEGGNWCLFMIHWHEWGSASSIYTASIGYSRAMEAWP